MIKLNFVITDLLKHHFICYIGCTNMFLSSKVIEVYKFPLYAMCVGLFGIGLFRWPSLWRVV